MDLGEWIGFLAASLTTASFLPQAVMVLRTRRTDDISLAMYAMFTTGVAGWLVYGAMIGSTPMIIANTITLLLASCILAVKAQSVLQRRTQGASASKSTPISR